MGSLVMISEATKEEEFYGRKASIFWVIG